MQDDGAGTRESWKLVEARNRGNYWMPIDPNYEYFQCPCCGKQQTMIYGLNSSQCPYCGEYVCFES